jgi:hypothetical protein
MAVHAFGGVRDSDSNVVEVGALESLGTFTKVARCRSSLSCRQKKLSKHEQHITNNDYRKRNRDATASRAQISEGTAADITVRLHNTAAAW